jgi:O-6-methylguanine DNA methyltransferase
MTYQLVYELVQRIPYGKVLTYKSVADILRVKDIRIVGFALHRNKHPETVPCHRVVRNDGSIAKGYVFGGAKKQIEKLRGERVIFGKDSRVDLAKSLWRLSEMAK